MSSSSLQVAFNQKRRTTRVYREIAMTVQGTDAFLAPYRDQVSTVTVNCHGCRYQTKHEVIQGDTVFLNVISSDQSDSPGPRRARVKWVQRRPNKERPFEVAVELDAPGNIWGIASEPEDWLPTPESQIVDRATSVPPRQEAASSTQQMAADPDREGRIAGLERNDAGPSVSPVFNQLMVGFGEQIQTMASDAARVAVTKERNRLMEEFRFQLQIEAKKTLAAVVVASKEELTRQVMKELKEAYDLAAQSNFQRWIQKFEREMENAKQLMATHGQEVSQRIDNMALSTIERLQRNLEAAHRDGADRLSARLRERLAPVLEDAQAISEKLAGSGKIFKQEAQTSYLQFRNSLQQAGQKLSAETQEKIAVVGNQFEAGMKDKLSRASEELNGKLAKVLGECIEAIRKVSKSSENEMRQTLESLATSAADYEIKVLREKTAEISRQFLIGLEASTRSYLESVSESLNQITSRTSVHAHE